MKHIITSLLIVGAIGLTFLISKLLLVPLTRRILNRFNKYHSSNFTLAQTYSADEAFVTGTLGGVTPVTRIDGRTIGDGKAGPMTLRASELYLRGVAPA